MPIPDRQKSVTICSLHSFRHSIGIGQTDRQTDRRTELPKQYRTLHALHSGWCAITN